jgi:lysophospholipase L1-like esterase
VPDYMTRTIGLNDVATVQYKNSVRHIYYCDRDSKEELAIAAIFYASIQEFQEEFEKILSRTKKKEQVVNHYLQQKMILNLLNMMCLITIAN